MMLRAVINPRRLIQAQKLFPQKKATAKISSMVEIIHSPFTPEVLTQDVDYHTESDTAHTQLQYFKRQRNFS